MIVQQLGLTKRNILCKIEPNSLPKESRYLKIPRNKLVFSGFSCPFGFYPLKFCSKENLRDRKAKFYLFGVFDPNQVSKGILRNFPLLLLKMTLFLNLFVTISFLKELSATSWKFLLPVLKAIFLNSHISIDVSWKFLEYFNKILLSIRYFYLTFIKILKILKFYLLSYFYQDT